MDWEDYGFEPPTPKSRYVACVLCGHTGGGVAASGIIAQVFLQEGHLLPWQRRHMRPHKYLCACGRGHPTLQALGTHVAANRRHHVPGHGSMERVGY